MSRAEKTGGSNAPLALVNGKVFADPPNDLYIPSQSMRVLLETFEGPLDLLLYLIRRKVVDILALSITEITRQYMEYVKVIRKYSLDFLAEYLAMAAWLAEIKSRLLLPEPVEETEENDPRAELFNRLLEYRRFKECGENLDLLSREERDVFVIHLAAQTLTEKRPEPDVELPVLASAMQSALSRQTVLRPHRVTSMIYSTSERMALILTRLETKGRCSLEDCFGKHEGVGGLVATFLGVLELTKSRLIDSEQTHAHSSIHFYLRHG